jgi:hypothetical protein
MKKKSIFKRIYLYIKRKKNRLGMWKIIPQSLQVDLGKKSR